MSQFDHQSRVISAEGIMNLRDLGGLPAAEGRIVKKRLLYRSGKLDFATDADIRMLTEQLHISRIVDFRMEDEVRRAPDPEISGVKNIYLKVFQNQSAFKNLRTGDAKGRLQNIVDKHLLQNFYWEILRSERGQNGYRDFLRILAEVPEGEGVLLHCFEGKDRAGLGAALILHILGVSQELILEDFLYSNVVYAERIEAFRKNILAMGFTADEEIEELMTVAGVSGEYLKNTFSKVEDAYGSLDLYIKNKLGVDDEMKRCLQEKYLCEAI